MLGAGDRVALVEVVGAHSVLQELLHELLHDLWIIVHPLHQYGLRAERASYVSQFGQRFLGLRCKLRRVVEVDVHEDRMVIGDQLAQLRRDPLRQVAGYSRVDADDLNVGDIA